MYLGYSVAPWTAGLPGTAAVVTFNRIVRYTNIGTKADPASRFIVIGKDAADGYMSVCGSSHAFGTPRHCDRYKFQQHLLIFRRRDPFRG